MRDDPIPVTKALGKIARYMGESPTYFYADELGLSLQEVFEPGAFLASAFSGIFVKGTLVRVQGTDGRCWAEVTGITENGRLIIEPDSVPSLMTKARKAA